MKAYLEDKCGTPYSRVGVRVGSMDLKTIVDPVVFSNRMMFGLYCRPKQTYQNASIIPVTFSSWYMPASRPRICRGAHSLIYAESWN